MDIDLPAVVGAETITADQLLEQVRSGGRFVQYSYCVSILVMTFQRPTNIRWVSPHDSRVGKGLPYLLTSLLLGWWGFPWGPIYTVGSLVRCLKGGKDLTALVLNQTDTIFGPGFATEDQKSRMRNLALDIALNQN
ncbi:MAG: hypothetical protein H6686_00235 [Fibrobacteria bacterium]|nr:hypothetical protein [Fibrobacteria bacterium]